MAAAAALDRPEDDRELHDASRAAQGSVGRAIALLGGRTLAIREKVIDLLGRLPATDPEAMHALADALARADGAVLEACVDTMSDWWRAPLSAARANASRLARAAAGRAKLNRAAGEDEEDRRARKPVVCAAFG